MTTNWDVFISHASEDKEIVAKPLAMALIDAGLKVWFDKFTLKLGDSLRQMIDDGLKQSRYGVVILSPSFFQKRWPQTELNSLIAKEVNGEKVILPVWYNLGFDEVASYSLILADRMAAKMENGLESVVEEIKKAVIIETDDDKEKSLVVVGAINILRHEITFEGKLISSNVYGFIKDNTAYAPIWACAIALGISVYNIISDEENKMITILKRDKVIQFEAESPVYRINGKEYQTERNTLLENGQIYHVPSAVAQVLGGNALWDPLTVTILFSSYR